MMLVERFGWEFYRNPSHPTSDHIVPAAWAVTALGTIEALDAQRQLTDAHSVAHGAALALNGKDAGVRRLTSDLHRAAFPLVHPRPADDEETLTDG